MLKIRFEGNNLIIIEFCTVCGRSFDLDIVCMGLYDEDGFVGWVCPNCLKLTHEEIKEQFLERVKDIEREIGDLKSYKERFKSYSKEEIDGPGFDEYNRVVNRVKRFSEVAHEKGAIND